jgi:hypothetical protein
MPYGYYQFVRVAAAAAAGIFAYTAYTENQSGNKQFAFTFIVLAFLFQPFIKIVPVRILWNIFDVVVGLGLLGYSAKKQ